MSLSKYVKESVRNCEKHLAEHYKGKYRLPNKAPNPFPVGFAPELDDSPELGPDEASYYASLVGMMRWMIELGRVDIATEVSELSSYLALPREGQFQAALHLMGYLKKHHNATLVLDPSKPKVNEEEFPRYDWEEYYHDAHELIPHNAPSPRGESVDLRLYVDSDHAGEKRTRRSRTGFLIYLNSTLIQWLSKRQSTIESSVFGAEFVALKVGIETLRGIRYKLRMMGVPLSGPSCILGDNMSVVKNSQAPHSVLTKKCNSVCYHAVREAVAMGECLVRHIRSENNLADFLTKLLTGIKRTRLVSRVLYNIYDDHEGFQQ